MEAFEQARHIVLRLHRLRVVLIESTLHVAMSNMAHGDESASSAEIFFGHVRETVKEIRDISKMLRDGDPEHEIEGKTCQHLMQNSGFDGNISDLLQPLLRSFEEFGQLVADRTEIDFETLSKHALSIPRARDVIGKLITHCELEAAKMEEEHRQSTNSTATVDGALSEISALTQSLNMVAINGAIEASRAGAEGAGFRVLAGEMHRLSDRAAQTLKIARSALATNDATTPPQ
ncbi:MAG: methyl-accepting chemotaxis protein [Pseudomonadota bacterium]